MADCLFEVVVGIQRPCTGLVMYAEKRIVSWMDVSSSLERLERTLQR